MAEPLKNLYGPDIPVKIAAMISGVYSGFDKKAFITDCLDGYEALELMPRGWKIAHTLKRHLPGDFPEAIGILVRSFEPVHQKTQGEGLASFLYMPHAFFVAEYGLDHFEVSMRAQYEITQRFTAEFSIRPFLEKHQARTLAHLRQWASDPDPHVRRLVSEGIRPRLPWAGRLREFQKNPAPVLELLELLKDDPELYVRRSVANNLNDIGKDHPDLLVQTAKKWMKGAGPDRKWIIRHALRSLIKQGNAGALAVLGYAGTDGVVIRKKQIAPGKVSLGQTVEISFEVVNQSGERQRLMIDFRVHYVKASGKTGIKVFKLKACLLGAEGKLLVTKKIALKDLTTRKHYPGLHRVDILLNGQVIGLGDFELRK